MNGFPLGFPSPLFWAMEGKNTGEALPDYLLGFLKGCEVHDGISHNALTLFPITCPQSGSLPSILTLDEAVEKKLLKISEVGREGTVNKIRLLNSSQHYVFIMAGEILIGCKQDRTLEEDILLAPNTEEITASAFCVEAGRWHRVSDEFIPAEEAATPRVRQVARLTRSQSAVWNEIAYFHMALNIKAGTGALREVYITPKTKDTIKEYMKVMGELPESLPQVSGVAVAIGGKLLCLDLFCDKKMFDALYPKLLKSYAVEAMIESEKKDGISKEKMALFINSLLNGKAKHMDSPGAGEHWELVAKDAQGSCLVFEGNVLHLSAFPRKTHEQRRSSTGRTRTFPRFFEL
ncbi:hypothetical protein H5T87_11165 [bacterium]|nr:hypothetical protein [bacterium]